MRHVALVPEQERKRLDAPVCRYLKAGAENELLFLHDSRVPSNNSLSERMARVYKRKQKQVMVMRSFDNLKHLCTSLGMVRLLRQKGGNTYMRISDVFRRRNMTKGNDEAPESQ